MISVILYEREGLGGKEWVIQNQNNYEVQTSQTAPVVHAEISERGATSGKLKQYANCPVMSHHVARQPDQKA